jgi:HAD superfamily hydrolase (TIGR01490 family)
MVALAIFDLDETLLAGDSDYLWGEFLVERGVVDRAHHERENERFYRQYREGSLDIQAWLRFQLAPLATNDPQYLRELRERFLVEKIQPIVLPAALALVERHRRDGDTPIIITSTNSFITRPIASLFGIADLLATEPEMAGDRYTGRVAGTPCFRDGKVVRIGQWLEGRPFTLAESWFYSDSRNDLPLLERVGHPTAVDPDETLARYARERAWPIISLR